MLPVSASTPSHSQMGCLEKGIWAVALTLLVLTTLAALSYELITREPDFVMKTVPEWLSKPENAALVIAATLAAASILSFIYQASRYFKERKRIKEGEIAPLIGISGATARALGVVADPNVPSGPSRALRIAKTAFKALALIAALGLIAMALYDLPQSHQFFAEWENSALCLASAAAAVALYAAVKNFATYRALLKSLPPTLIENPTASDLRRGEREARTIQESATSAPDFYTECESPSP